MFCETTKEQFMKYITAANLLFFPEYIGEAKQGETVGLKFLLRIPAMLHVLL